jgi:putative PIN family toxin of toxin-antitoxin system
MPVTVVFDTSILFSATGWRGHPFRCVELARSSQVRAVTCEEILRELAEKLAAKLAFSGRQVDETLADYLSFHTLVGIPGVLDAVPRDAEDNAILECAQAGQAQFVITGDDDLLTLRSFQAIELLSAAEFQRRWQAGMIVQ